MRMSVCVLHYCYVANNDLSNGLVTLKGVQCCCFPYAFKSDAAECEEREKQSLKQEYKMAHAQPTSEDYSKKAKFKL